MGTVGFIDIDQIPEGPNRAAMYPTFVDDPTLLENVKLWMGQSGEDAYFMSTGVQSTDSDGDDIYVFNFDTRQGRLLLPDGSLDVSYNAEEGASTINISSISESSGVVTVDTQFNHSYSVGNFVRISGTSNYDGSWEIGGIPDSSTFQFSISSSAPSESTGTVVKVNQVPEYTVLSGGVKYDAAVTYTSTAITEVRAIAARAKVTVSKSLAIQ